MAGEGNEDVYKLVMQCETCGTEVQEPRGTRGRCEGIVGHSLMRLCVECGCQKPFKVVAFDKAKESMSGELGVVRTLETAACALSIAAGDCKDARLRDLINEEHDRLKDLIRQVRL